MFMPRLFHELLHFSALKTPNATAIQHKEQTLSYKETWQAVERLAQQLIQLDFNRDQRLAVYLPKQFQTVISFFAASLAGGTFVPVNPLLKAPQISYILDDCEVSVLVTSLSRYRQLEATLANIQSIKSIILTDCTAEQTPANCICWQSLVNAAIPTDKIPARISLDMAAILYTSGSTGNPKGVVLSHQNLVAGAKSVSQYLENRASDRILAVLPFSFDYGLSQITTAFFSGASVVLMEYLLPRDVIKAIVKFKITCLAAVPPLWVQLAELDWPESIRSHLRYWTNSGGAMPKPTLDRLRKKLPETLPYLMYGLTEAFRSTYLAPAELDNRPGSMGRAIPDAEILVLDPQGKPCEPGEAGELVHRGPHVAMGYWNAPEKTAMRFKPIATSNISGLNQEIAVWSGDTVKQDTDGFLYFIGRQDDMIKSSGYRISPTEIEECVYQHPSVSEVAAIGVPHQQLGQAIVLVIKAVDAETFDEKYLDKFCKKQLPNFMQPKSIKLTSALPRNPNGKINRNQLVTEYYSLFNE